MSQAVSSTPYTPAGVSLRLHRPETPPAPPVSPPRRTPRGRVLVVRGYSRRWPALSRALWWLRLVPARLTAG